MLGPSTTPVETPPTRSATAERALATNPSVRDEDGKIPPRLATGTRIAEETACTTLSGTSVPPGASVCTKPSDRPGNWPRTRATSSRGSPGCMPGTLVGARGLPRRAPTTPARRSTRRRAGPDGGRTAPGNGSERPQQVLVVGPDGRPVGAMPVPAAGPAGRR